MNANKDGGVSPVIATILMVAITVVLAVTLYIMIGNMNMENPNTSSPVQFVPKKDGEHNWTLSVATDKDLRPIDLKYSILTKNYTYIVIGAQFPLDSGKNDSNGVTWIDANKDGYLDTGDTIQINNDKVFSGYIFKFTSGAQGEVELPY